LITLKNVRQGFFEPYNDTTSNGLTKDIVDWINYSGGDANRINTQGQARKERIELAFAKAAKE
jgi:hypothetical protein